MDPDVARILDANFNRAREALRVLEDYARFARDDAAAAERSKRVRHALADLAAAFPAAPLLAARNVAGDVGAAISTPQEASRGSTRDIAIAAAKRASEALRSLEEYAKLVHPGVAARFERLRYDTYEIEQSLVLEAPSLARVRRARLHVLLTESLCRRPWLDVAAASLDGGADLLQLREKSLSDRELLDRAARLVELAHSRNAAVIINDRPDIARLAAADGVHLGQDDLPPADARRIVGPALAIGRSTHDADQLRRAIEDNADYIAVGPMFQSQTKSLSAIAGPTLASQAAALTDRPVVAIGGITPSRLPELHRASVRRVAVCNAVIAADDPAAACRELIRALDR